MTKPPKSKCCNAEVITHCADEGTCCWVCSECKKATDTMESPEFTKEKEKIIKDIAERLLQLNQNAPKPQSKFKTQ